MKKILIVEDDKNIAMAMSIRLKAYDYDIELAHDAVVATTRANNYKPDLILLDIMLPGGNGLMLAERFKEMPDIKDVPIVFISASRKPGLKQKAMDVGGADFIEKPFDSGHLLCTVAGLINKAA